jgi:dihydrolipoamide dehydrogenase
MEKKMKIILNTEATEVNKNEGVVNVLTRDIKTGSKTTYSAEKILIAAGRLSNADLLMVEKTGVKTDNRGFIEVNEHLETSKSNIWAIGDANGKQMFRHVANDEAELAWHNSIHKATASIKRKAK